MRIAIAFILTLCSALLWAQDTPPKISLKLNEKAVAGANVKGTLTVTFAEGLHGYQNPQEDPTLIPVEVQAADAATKIVKVEYPKGKDFVMTGDTTPVKVYGGTIQIPVTFKMPDQAGPAELKVRLAYQQCDDSNCFAPSSVLTSLKVTVEKKTVKKAPTKKTPPPKKKAAKKDGSRMSR